MEGSFFEGRARKMYHDANSRGRDERDEEAAPWADPSASKLTDVHVIGTTVARSDAARVILKSVSVFKDGYLLDFTARAESGLDLGNREAIVAWRRQTLESMKAEHVDGFAVGLLRIEAHLASGLELTPSEYVLPSVEAPKTPIMREISGAGYAASESGIWIEPKMWVWPAINEPVLVRVEWPAFGIESTEFPLDFTQLA